MGKPDVVDLEDARRQVEVILKETHEMRRRTGATLVFALTLDEHGQLHNTASFGDPNARDLAMDLRRLFGELMRETGMAEKVLVVDRAVDGKSVPRG